MAMVTLTINGQTVQAPEGQRLLWAAEDAGIYIPHLCAHPDREPPFGGCRLCYVEIEGHAKPVTSCTEPVQDGMVVRTDTPVVQRLVRTGFQLLISAHDLDCKVCPAKRDCGLRHVSRKSKVKLRSGNLPKLDPGLPVDDSHPLFGLNPNRCILCGLCIWVCEEQVGKGLLQFAQRGLETQISTFDNAPLADHDCSDDCLHCVDICPVGALYRKPTTDV